MRSGLAEFTVINGDCEQEITKLADNSIDVVFTAPSPISDNETLYKMKNIFSDKCLKPKLKNTGTLWYELIDYHNLDTGDYSHAAVMFEAVMCFDNEWILRNRIIWQNRRGTGQDDYTRCKRDYGFVYGFTKNKSEYCWNGRECPRWSETSVWPIMSEPYRDFVSGFPQDLIRRCLMLTVPQNQENILILDPFAGTGTTGIVALQKGWNTIQIEIDPDIIKKLKYRLSKYGVEKTWH